MAADVSRLKKAVELIRGGKMENARQILREVLRSEPTHSQAWYLLSFAVSERKQKVYSLQQALRADPQFTRARQKLGDLLGSPPPTGKKPVFTEALPVAENALTPGITQLPPAESNGPQKPAKLGPRFMRLWQASATSFLADGIWVAAGPLLAATLTRDPLLIAGLVTAQRLPWLLFSLPSGAIVDRADRKRIMWVGNAIRAALIVCLAAFAYLQLLNIYIMYAFFFLLGTIEPFFDNASFALLPRVVEPQLLEKANSRLFASLTISADFVGPPLGSFLFSLFPPFSFILSGFAYSGSSGLMASLPGEYKPHRTPAPINRMFAEIKEGFAFFWSNSVLRTLAFLVTLQNLVWTGCYSLLVLYAQDRLGLSNVGYGFLISAGAVGGFLGSITAEYGGKRFGTGRTVFAMVAITSFAFVVMGIAANTYITMVMLAINSFAISHAVTLILALRQSLIPDELLGRVTSVYRFIAIGAAPLGSLTAGLLARSFSITTPFWTGGILILIASLIAYPYINNRAIQLAREKTAK